jgi:hypothetical protein
VERVACTRAHSGFPDFLRAVFISRTVDRLRFSSFEVQLARERGAFEQQQVG